jgi:hypothetical protein
LFYIKAVGTKSAQTLLRLERKTIDQGSLMDIDPNKVCFVIVKAREFDVKEGVVEPDPGSNPTDDAGRSVLADYPDDPVYEELTSFIDYLNVDEQAQLVALAWLGRGDYSIDEWDAAVTAARERQTGSTARYLLGIPILADLLEEGLSQHGQSCEDFERGHL